MISNAHLSYRSAVLEGNDTVVPCHLVNDNENHDRSSALGFARRHHGMPEKTGRASSRDVRRRRHDREPCRRGLSAPAQTVTGDTSRAAGVTVGDSRACDLELLFYGLLFVTQSCIDVTRRHWLNAT